MSHFIVIIGVILAIAHSALACKCIAPKKCDAVCGSDGVTYSSECYLICHSMVVPYCLTVVHKGPCKKPKCNCKENKPCQYVCATDGKKGYTFGNDCTLKCAQKFNNKLKKIKNGKCGDCICTQQVEPVCASNGVTFGNPCMFKCQQELEPKLKIVCKKECPCKCDWAESTCKSSKSQTTKKSSTSTSTTSKKHH